MARLVERILVWVAVLLTVAAVTALIVNLVPFASRFFPWLHPAQETSEGVVAPIDLAEQALRAGDTHGALRFAALAVSRDSSDAAVDNRAGNVALRTGATSAAERYYLAGESADPRYPWNFVALGQLYEREGKKEPADAQLRAASVAAPDLPFVHYDLGVVELQEHLYAAAFADFNSELKRSPSYRPAMIGRAEALEKMGRRGAAIALYQRAGVARRQANAKPPALAIKPLVQPSPAPSASPLPRVVLFTSKATAPAAASGAQPRPTSQAPSKAGTTPTVVSARPPWATAPATQATGSAVAAAPTSAPKSLGEVAADARSYLLDVAQDLSFTRSLPAADPNQSTVALRSKLADALARNDPEAALEVGAAALLSGRVALASNAFSAASDAAPHDWRGPYFAGLTALATGDMQQASTSFSAALDRQPRAEAYTSLAVVDLEDGDTAKAAVNAHKAVEMNASYEPGRFVAGVVDLVQADVRGAQSNLSAAVALGGAPSRTAYFLSALRDSLGQANIPGG